MENDILQSQALLDQKLKQQVTPGTPEFYKAVGFSVEEVKMSKHKEPIYIRVLNSIKNSRFIPRVKFY